MASNQNAAAKPKEAWTIPGQMGIMLLMIYTCRCKPLRGKIETPYEALFVPFGLHLVATFWPKTLHQNQPLEVFGRLLGWAALAGPLRDLDLPGAYDCHGGFPSFCDPEVGRRAGSLALWFPESKLSWFDAWFALMRPCGCNSEARQVGCSNQGCWISKQYVELPLGLHEWTTTVPMFMPNVGACGSSLFVTALSLLPEGFQTEQATIPVHSQMTVYELGTQPLQWSPNRPSVDAKETLAKAQARIGTRHRSATNSARASWHRQQRWYMLWSSNVHIKSSLGTWQQISLLVCTFPMVVVASNQLGECWNVSTEPFLMPFGSRLQIPKPANQEEKLRLHRNWMWYDAYN